MTAIYTLSAETFVAVLGTLSELLDRAEGYASENRLDAAELLSSRLAPDMFPLFRQVQLACHHAEDAIARLTGESPPALPQGDPPSLAELKALIVRTSERLRAVPLDALESAAEKPVTLDLQGARRFEADGLHFLCRWSLPHFYFHVVTAYDILRHKGLAIGKKDYMSHIAPFIHSGAPT